MPATHEPCPACNGLGHVCKEPADHIHTHDPAPPCKRCGGRSLTPIAAPEAGEAGETAENEKE